MNYKQNYTFHVQSPEDFYRQLKEFNQQDQQLEDAIDLKDLSEAKQMLNQIGIKTKD